MRGQVWRRVWTPSPFTPGGCAGQRPPRKGAGACSNGCLDLSHSIDAAYASSKALTGAVAHYGRTLPLAPVARLCSQVNAYFITRVSTETMSGLAGAPQFAIGRQTAPTAGGQIGTCMKGRVAASLDCWSRWAQGWGWGWGPRRGMGHAGGKRDGTQSNGQSHSLEGRRLHPSTRLRPRINVHARSRRFHNRHGTVGDAGRCGGPAGQAGIGQYQR